jgi:sugar O-acyltransferase (sialic acid O-acetyltransferase NeuD family)
MPDTTVLLAGAASFAEEIGDLCASAGVTVAGWIEGLDPGAADPAADPPILWVDDQAAFRPELPVLPAIGSVGRWDLIERLVAEGRRLATFVHPTAVVAPSAVIEPGCVVFPLVVIGARTTIGRGTIVNRGSLIGHHTTIGPGCFLGPGSNVAGKIELGRQVHIGIGGVVRDRVRIGDHATVGTGAVVVGDVEPGSTVVGVPAKPIVRR